MFGKTERVRAGRICVAVVLLAGSFAAAAQQEVYVDAGRGPVRVHVPAAYAEGIPIPLVVILHGRRSNAERLEYYVQFTPVSDQRGFLLAFPNGPVNSDGYRYWNATDACCGDGVLDDSGYLRDLVEVITAQFTVDSRRIAFFGNSNGGFMAHRVGCDHADVVAAIASMSGAQWNDPAMCVPTAPMNALEIHGTKDEHRFYGGGCTEPDVCYPSAPQTAQTWGDLNHCTGSEDSVGLDLTSDIPGVDTRLTTYSGCDHGGSSQLWTIVNGRHHPGLSPQFNDVVVQYLLSHPRPSDIPCGDVSQFRAQCGQTGVLAVDVGVIDTIHDGKTIDVTVDEDTFVAPVLESHGQVVLTGRSPGTHVVGLVEPASCVADLEVTCGS